MCNPSYTCDLEMKSKASICVHNPVELKIHVHGDVVYYVYNIFVALERIYIDINLSTYEVDPPTLDVFQMHTIFNPIENYNLQHGPLMLDFVGW